MLHKKSLSIVMALAGAALATAAVVQGITPKYQPKVGETHEYSLKGSVDVMGQTAELTGVSVVSVLKADDATYVHETKETMKINVGGQEIPEQSSTTRTVMALGGKVTAVEGEGLTLRGANMGQFIEPGKEVKIGDVWSYEGKADTKASTPSYKIDYKYLADEKVGTWDTAKFSADAKETEGEKPQIFSTVLWLDKTDFSVVKMEVKFQNMINPAVPAPLNGTLALIRTK